MIDLIGQRFGALRVVKREGSARNGAATAPTWLVKCDCGGTKVVRGANLRKGATTSCGCKQRPHGMFGTPEYSAWTAMQQRCSNPKARAWKSHGARGISVCPRWTGPQGFERFFADMGRRPTGQHSLDRIDNNGHYEPSNCRWATLKQQARNKRTSRVLVVDGVSATVAEWAERVGLGTSTLKERLKRGWTPSRAVRTPAR